MTTKLDLAQIQPPDLIEFDRENFTKEIISRLKKHPLWSDNYNGLFHYDALTMLLSITNFQYEKIAEHTDRKLRELYLSSARSSNSKAKILNDNNIIPKQNTESVALLKGTFINANFSESFTIPKGTLVYANSLNNKSVPFEIILKNDNGYNYVESNNITINPGLNLNSFTIECYSGETYRYEYELDVKKEFFTIEIPYEETIEGSVKVYFYVNGIYYKLKEDSLENTEKEITSIFPKGVPCYALRYDSSGRPIIFFGSYNFGGSFHEAHKDGSIVVYGRSGGGENSNIPAGAINSTISVTLGNGLTYDINFTNITDANGGVDRESIKELSMVAPFRMGRGKQIIDKTDAINALSNRLIKHEIDSPTYEYEKSNSVPLLHQFHYMIPERDFNNFVFPLLISSDTLDSYIDKFVTKITEFCNVKGTHDNPIFNEFITNFIYSNLGYSFYYAELKNKTLLSNTLKLKAYNIYDIKIDEIEFEGNYPLLKIINNKSINERAEANSKSISSVVISSSAENKINNKLSFSFDDHDYIFNVTLASGTYVKTNLAEALQIGIKTLIEQNLHPNVIGYTHDLYTIRESHKFVNYDDNGIVFISPKYGSRSKIVFYGNEGSASYNLCNDLGFKIGSYRPDRTKLVFKAENSYFDYFKNELYIDIETSGMSMEEVFNKTVSQNEADQDGPFFELSLYDKYLEQPQQLQNGKDITVEFWDTTTNNKVDECVFPQISNLIETVLAKQGENYTGNVLRNASECKLNLEEAKLQFQLKNAISSPAYKAGYKDDFGMIVYMQVFSTETIDGITTDTQLEIFDSQLSWDQSINSEAGTIIYLTLSNQNLFEVGKSYKVKIFCNKGTGDMLVETIMFDSIVVGVNNGIGTTGNIQTVESGKEAKYNTSTGIISITTINGVIDNSVPQVWKANYSYFNRIIVKYSRKNYNYILADYKANPYHPENEAKIYMDILNQKQKRAIGVENLAKDVNFIPYGIELDLYLKKGFSENLAKDAIYNILITMFGYDNDNPSMTLDHILTNSDLVQFIMPYASNYGIVNVVVNKINIINKIPAGRCYYFLLDNNLMNSLKNISDNYTILNGMNNKFEIKINTIVV